MKIVFVAMSTENLSLGFLSSFLKKHGHQVELVFDPTLFQSEVLTSKKLSRFFDTQDQIAQQVVNKKPDLVGFSVFTLNYQRTLNLAKKIKKLNKNLPIILGGIHPTSVPNRVIKQKVVDMVCVGEGEYALLELLNSLKNKKPKTDIKNIWFKKDGKIIKNSCRPLIKNLNSLPFPDKDLFYTIYPKFITNDYYAISSRGCPFSCTYCANNVLHKVYHGLGPSVRRRTPENIVKELEIAKKKYSPKQITFADDVFVQDISWLKKFANLYKKRVNLPYVMLTHPRFITYQITKLLKNSGCFLLMFGIQSASETTRAKILKRYETNKQIEKAAQDCHKAGLKFSIDHIFNIPGEGLKDHHQALSFYNKLRPSIIHSYWLQYFPGTEIVKTAIQKKIISKSDLVKIEEGKTSTSLVVGIGGKDNFDPNLVYKNLQFFFTLLPIIPQKLMDKIIDKKLYLTRFNPPLILNIVLKFIINLINRRGGVYLSIIKSILYFSSRNLATKLSYIITHK